MEDLQTPSDLLIQPGQGHGTSNQSFEAKLQANSEEIKNLSSSFANVQTMIATLLDKQEKQQPDTLKTSQDEAREQDYFLDEVFGQQGACYDPQQSFELDSNVAAVYPC